MSEPYIEKRSFKFNGVDMYDKFGIVLRKMPNDYLLPELRSRKKEIPMRSGMYDYGARYYNERSVELSCMIDRGFPYNESAMREIAYFLSKKGQLHLWNCPEKYYLGRIYNTVQKNQDLKISTEFDLSFICDPFAYGEVVSNSFNMALSMVYEKYRYKGTADTAARFEITNPTGMPAATTINIRISYKR